LTSYINLFGLIDKNSLKGIGPSSLIQKNKATNRQIVIYILENRKIGFKLFFARSIILKLLRLLSLLRFL